ncbi:DUF4238 domain-containing protein [Streptomyces drozdowiczii]|nr:DUF4238 domain-containing protein [Streptomyces drozdowiczii]MCX0247897.1 DUF4238 domain-containing protein [Streptomyces drozdowiczii]
MTEDLRSAVDGRPDEPVDWESERRWNDRSRGKKAAAGGAVPGQTRDHTVPQMYLRGFAQHQGRRQYMLAVRRLTDLMNPFPATPPNVLAIKGFYWGTTRDGEPHHALEEVFIQIEGDAAPGFRMILEAPEGALPAQWPLPEKARIRLAWWVAAQILRTTRQRKRLTHTIPASEKLDAPVDVARLAANNHHLQYIVEQLAGLAFVIYSRPWGVGFSDVCLMTSDVPVMLFNGQDANDQLGASTVCDIFLPLDSHRFLLLPSPAKQSEDRRKRSDHRLKMSGGLGLAFNQIIYDAADAYLVHHPQHDPFKLWQPHDGPRLPRPWDAIDHPAPSYAFSYGTLPELATVERRWLTEHPHLQRALARQATTKSDAR